MSRIALSSLAAAVLVAAALAGQAPGSTAVLEGTTGPGFKIELDRGGKVVKTLKAGMYAIKVRDRATSHNFHLFGPGVNKKTTVPFMGTQTWTVRLKPGRYTYQCDVHASLGMKGTFRVTS